MCTFILTAGVYALIALQVTFGSPADNVEHQTFKDIISKPFIEEIRKEPSLGYPFQSLFKHIFAFNNTINIDLRNNFEYPVNDAKSKQTSNTTKPNTVNDEPEMTAFDIVLQNKLSSEELRQINESMFFDQITKCKSTNVFPGRAMMIDFNSLIGKKDVDCQLDITTVNRASIRIICNWEGSGFTHNCDEEFLEIGKQKFCQSGIHEFQAERTLSMHFKSKYGYVTNNNKFECAVVSILDDNFLSTTPTSTEIESTDGDCTCGGFFDSSTVKIDLGEEAPVNQKHWAGIWLRDRGAIICRGSILTDEIILTAASCFRGNYNSVKNNGFVAMVGQQDINSFWVPYATQAILVDSFILHEDYFFNKTIKINDVALVKLKHKIIFNERVGPICLPQGDQSYAGMEAVVARFKCYDHNGKHQYHKLHVVTNEECSIHHYNIRDDMICAGGEEFNNCMITSGESLIAYIDGANTTVEQIGVVSSFDRGWGRSKAPRVFMRVSEYMDWITPKLSGKICRRP